MKFVELDSFSSVDFLELVRLIRKLDDTVEVTEESLKALLDSADTHLYVARDGERIVASACLCVYHQPFRTDASIESVVVATECRGQGLGRMMVEHLIAEAGRLGVSQLHLTSRPSRLAANALYMSLGFEKKETNCYVMDIRQ